MSVILVLIILRYISNENSFIKLDTKIVLSMIIAGVIGNTIDRIFRGNVINFINIGKLISINISYIYIIAGWILITFLITKNTSNMIKERKKKKEIKIEYEKNRNK